MFNGAAIAAGLFPALAFAGLTVALAGGWEGRLALCAARRRRGLAAIAILIAPYLRNFGGYTVPDFLAERFNLPGIRGLAVVAVILSAFPALALTLLGLGAIATRIFAIDLATGVAFAAALLLACSFVAGMRSASLTQIVQCAVLFAAALVATVLLLGQGGTFVPARGDAGLQALVAIAFETFAADDKLNRFALLFSVATGLAAMPHLLLRSLVTPSTEAARTSFLWAMLFIGVLCLVGVPSLALLGETPGRNRRGSAAPRIWICGRGRHRRLACARQRAGRDPRQLAVLRPLLQGRATHRIDRAAHLRCAAALVAVAVLAAWAVLARPGSDPCHDGGAFSFAASTLLPGLLLGIWWKRASGEGALPACWPGRRVPLLHVRAALYPVRLLRDVELSLQRDSR